MRERLQKILSAPGVASRRKAEQMIRDGLVTVNGFPAALGDSADPELDMICINGQPLPNQQRSVYILLNKPRGYVTRFRTKRAGPTLPSWWQIAEPASTLLADWTWTPRACCCLPTPVPLPTN